MLWPCPGAFTYSCLGQDSHPTPGDQGMRSYDCTLFGAQPPPTIGSQGHSLFSRLYSLLTLCCLSLL